MRFKACHSWMEAKFEHLLYWLKSASKNYKLLFQNCYKYIQHRIIWELKVKFDQIHCSIYFLPYIIFPFIIIHFTICFPPIATHTITSFTHSYAQPPLTSQLLFGPKFSLFSISKHLSNTSITQPNPFHPTQTFTQFLQCKVYKYDINS